MTKDLLQVLRQNNELPADVEAQQHPGQPFDLPDPDGGMDEFFGEVEWIRESVDRIQGLVSQVRTKHSELLSAPQQNERTKQELEELTNSIKLLASQVRMKIKNLESVIAEQEAADPGSAVARVRRTQHTTITRRFLDVMSKYNKTQTEYRDACKAQMKMKLEVAERPVTDEELDEMLKSDNPQIFTQGILMDTQQARQNVADIEARHEDIMKLERSIRELYDLFNDLANLVETQGEMIDRIEYNVANTKDHVENAKIAVTQAVVYQKKSRKVNK
ncbi:unnamed protein product [Echinostoma caproni]|uniref:t-SNARE coiled-coil homology domain-containing protein n=1 Tax=Echinostoma caproni TaxID=27848 RepID=A0A183ABM0_9TREM|nr:unnamed protein product [Echinostoma caproni]